MLHCYAWEVVVARPPGLQTKENFARMDRRILLPMTVGHRCAAAVSAGVDSPHREWEPGNRCSTDSHHCTLAVWRAEKAELAQSESAMVPYDYEAASVMAQAVMAAG